MAKKAKDETAKAAGTASERDEKARRESAAAASGGDEKPKRGAKGKEATPAPRSGGPRERAAGEPILDNEGKPATHSPDLADNVAPGAAMNTRPVTRRGFTAPIEITDVDDVRELQERVRNEDKADVLYLWRDQERAQAKPRQDVISMIENRLLDVQGPPLHD
jgi:hypothetical protein